MDVKLKVKKETFNKIKSGQLFSIRHGFSINKKYSRLFINVIDSIFLVCDETGKMIKKQFKSIETTMINDKKYIQINFK